MKTLVSFKRSKCYLTFVASIATQFCVCHAFGPGQESSKVEVKSAPPKVTKSIVIKGIKPKSEPATRTDITGSYIKQGIRRTGHTTDGMSKVTIIDSDAIQRMGASDIAAALKRIPNARR